MKFLTDLSLIQDFDRNICLQFSQKNAYFYTLSEISEVELGTRSKWPEYQYLYSSMAEALFLESKKCYFGFNKFSFKLT